jgi:alpha-tubulin suppressor-like RCC1 family protein
MFIRSLLILVLLALTTACESYVAGDNTLGQLGISNTGADSGTFDVGAKWVKMESGYYHSCGITTQSKVWCWGLNSSGQIGASSGAGPIEYTPIQIGTATDWKEISPGGAHTCGIRTGQLWCWGNDSYGQIGNGLPQSNHTSPTRVGNSSDWTSVHAGEFHTCGIRAGGLLYCWGRNNLGQAGVGNTVAFYATPQLITAEGPWKTAAAGNDHTCGIDVADVLYCWGSNSNGQLGSNSIATGAIQTIPEYPVLRQDNVRVWDHLDTGTDFSCASVIDRPDTPNEDPFVFCWGNNQFGQVPNAPTANLTTPQLILSGQLDGSVLDYHTKPSVGGSHICVVYEGVLLDGSAYIDVENALCWGSNAANQLNLFEAQPDQTGQTMSVSAGFVHSLQLVFEG